MKLHLIRHAKTNQISPTGRDIDRELLPKGWAQLEILKKKIKPGQDDVILSSSSARTRQTSEILFPLSPVHFIDDFYLCSVKTFLEHIWKQQNSSDLWIIAHNFGISDLVEYFTNDELEMRTSEYICISFDIDSWMEASRSTGTIIDRFRPRPSHY